MHSQEPDHEDNLSSINTVEIDADSGLARFNEEKAREKIGEIPEMSKVAAPQPRNPLLLHEVGLVRTLIKCFSTYKIYCISSLLAEPTTLRTIESGLASPSTAFKIPQSHQLHTTIAQLLPPCIFYLSWPRCQGYPEKALNIPRRTSTSHTER